MIDEKKLIEELEKIFETDEQNIDCTLSDFAYHVFDCVKEQPKVGEWIPVSERSKGEKTNADRIREMTDEELAKEIAEKIDCMQCPFNDERCGAIECDKLFLDWLQSEADQQEPHEIEKPEWKDRMMQTFLGGRR